MEKVIGTLLRSDRYANHSLQTWIRCRLKLGWPDERASLSQTSYLDTYCNLAGVQLVWRNGVRNPIQLNAWAKLVTKAASQRLSGTFSVEKPVLNLHAS